MRRHSQANPSARITASQAGRASTMSGGTCSSTGAPVAASASTAARTAVIVSGVGVRMPLSPNQATRRPPTWTADGSPSGAGTTCGSSPSGPAMSGRTSARSSTRRAIGPSCVNDSNRPPEPGQCPVLGTRPLVGLIPATPHRCAGWRMLLPLSLPMSNGRAAGGDDRRRAAAAAAGRAVEVVRVRRPAVHVVVGLVGPGELGRVRLAQQDPAGAEQPRDDRRVAVRDAVAPADRARGRDDARRVERVLDRERDPVERAARRCPGRARRRRPRPLAGVGGEPDDRVDPRVDLVDAGEAGVDDLERRDLRSRDGAREPARRSGPEGHRHHVIVPARMDHRPIRHDRTASTPAWRTIPLSGQWSQQQGVRRWQRRPRPEIDAASDRDRARASASSSVASRPPGTSRRSGAARPRRRRRRWPPKAGEATTPAREGPGHERRDRGRDREPQGSRSRRRRRRARAPAAPTARWATACARSARLRSRTRSPWSCATVARRRRGPARAAARGSSDPSRKVLAGLRRRRSRPRTRRRRRGGGRAPARWTTALIRGFTSSMRGEARVDCVERADLTVHDGARRPHGCPGPELVRHRAIVIGGHHALDSIDDVSRGPLLGLAV